MMPPTTTYTKTQQKVLRGGGPGGGLTDEGVGAVRAVQHGDGHAVVPDRGFLLHDAPFLLLVDAVHERTDGEV